MTIYATANESTITIGKNFDCGQLIVFCIDESGLKLDIGDNCLFGWPVNIRMSDGHTIYDLQTRRPLNLPGNIHIGNHVWLARDVTLLKHAYLPDDTIVGMKTLITKPFTQKNTIIAGIPGRVIRRGVNWAFPHTEKYLKDMVAKNIPASESVHP